jgi:hypothetical protein
VLGAQPRSVLLVETPLHTAADPSTLVNTPSGALEHTRLTATETRVNHTLTAGRRCANAAQAAALWRARAAAAGIPHARYVLFTQADPAIAGRCARILVNSPGGGGPADVYAADLP